MKKSHEKVTILEERIIKEKKLLRGKGSGKNGKFTNADLVNIIGYSNEKGISLKGGLTIDKDRAQLLANYCKVRLEYLIGIDDWRSDEDKLNYLTIEDRVSFNKALEYLITLGFEIEPIISSYMSVTALYKNWNIISSNLTTTCQEYLCSKYDFNESYKDFSKKYFSKSENIEWRRPLDNIDYSFNIGIKEKTKQSIYIDYQDSKTKSNIDYFLQYRIKQNGQELYCKSISEMQIFIQQLNALATFAVNNILPHISSYPH